jgi:murein DD-endopeptidase MepM/ murein hydrolase activator NlpD
MRRLVVPLALLLPALAAASPAPGVATPASAHAALPLTERVAGWLERTARGWGEAAPGLDIPSMRMLTTEPVERTESSGYGWREDPIKKRQRFHQGTDFRARRGTPVLAAGAGVVTVAGPRGGYGNFIYVDHGGGVVTRYAHLRRIEVRLGAEVIAGQRIGQVGSTGRATGPHLHFEVRLHERAVDPVTAMLVAELQREAPTAGKLAAYALSPELQAKARDIHDRGRKQRKRSARPERPGREPRSQALW